MPLMSGGHHDEPRPGQSHLREGGGRSEGVAGLRGRDSQHEASFDSMYEYSQNILDHSKKNSITIRTHC